MTKQNQPSNHEFKTVHFCGGIGGCSLGMQQSEYEYRGVKGTFKTLFSVDVDAGACEAYEQITGSKAVNADMFSREQFNLFHGKEPPTDWHEVSADDLRTWANGEYPDVIFISAPCKGFSRLLPKATSQKPKYKALNGLALRALSLAMDAWGDNPPAVILFENVPGIETRGKHILAQIRHILGKYGYQFHEGHHDCGEIGQLGQRRIRYLMIARNPKKLMSFIYQPPKFKHQTIGDILGPLPMPGDMERGGKMHRMPRLAWRTWERLALIPAGKDWRALKDLHYTARSGAFRIVPWDVTAPTVTGSTGAGRSNGISGVADPRLGNLDGFGNKYEVSQWDKPSPVVTGSRIGSGAVIVDDPRIPDRQGKLPNAFQVEDWDKPARTIIGQTDIQAGALSVSDPRTEHYNNILKVCNWNEPGASITGGSGMQSGGLAVNDPRSQWGRYKVVKWEDAAPAIVGQSNVKGSALSVSDPRINHPTWKRTSLGKVADWDELGGAVIASPNISGAGTASVADPRISDKWSGAGNFKVMPWDEPSNAMTAHTDIHAAAGAVADPRIPDADERGVYIIIALDNTWHRPITTYEMAMLQGFPRMLPDGKPFELPGNSDAKWREWIGNAVPVQSATAMGNALLKTMLTNYLDDWYWDIDGNDLWVQEDVATV
jgi:site-specific DNA-cytosine methylase